MLTVFNGGFMEITYLDVNILVPFERNPRRITKAKFEKLCNNIQRDKEFFEMRPILVNATDEGMIVYAGNQRLKAAMFLKMETVPCIVQENVSKDVIKKRIVLDNITHGEFDYDLLACEYDMEDLLDLGMDGKELDIFDTDDLLAGEEDKSKEEEDDKKCECPKCGHKFDP